MERPRWERSRDPVVDVTARIVGAATHVRGHHRHIGRLRGMVALVRPADQLSAEPERVDDLGRGGQQRDDTHSPSLVPATRLAVRDVAAGTGPRRNGPFLA